MALPAPVPAPAPEAAPAPEQPRAFWEDGTVQGDDFFIEEDVSTMLWSPTPYGVRQQKKSNAFILMFTGSNTQGQSPQ